MAEDLNPPDRGQPHPNTHAAQVELGYRTWPMVADYCRGWIGLALAALPLATMQPAWPVGLALVAMMALFALFLVQTWQRQRSRVRLDPDSVALLNGSPRVLAWRDLDGMRLRWFGSRQVGRGWLELELRGGGERLVVTSALERFDELVAGAVRAADDRQLPLEPATRANLEAFLGRAA